MLREFATTCKLFSKDLIRGSQEKLGIGQEMEENFPSVAWVWERGTAATGEKA